MAYDGKRHTMFGFERAGFVASAGCAGWLPGLGWPRLLARRERVNQRLHDAARPHRA